MRVPALGRGRRPSDRLDSQRRLARADRQRRDASRHRQGRDGDADIHQGYGLPVGGVVATDARSGVVSPGAIGFDINCGVRLLKTSLRAEDIAGRMERLVDALYARSHRCRLKGLADAGSRPPSTGFSRAARAGVENGYGVAEDLGRIESEGCLSGASPPSVSARARERGKRQLGSLGSGNHFLEVQTVEAVYDPRVASALGLSEGVVTAMIHTARAVSATRCAPTT